MADTRQPPSDSAWADFCRRTAAMLPISPRTQLAAALAELWLHTTRAEHAASAVQTAPDGTWAAACASADGSASSVPAEINPCPSDAAAAPEWTDALSRTASIEGPARERAVTVSVAADNRPAAFVLLVPSAEHPLDLTLGDELQRWTRAVIDQARRNAETLEAEKIASLAEFAAGAGHEINNPLATISGRVQLLLRDETDVERRRALATIGGQAYRIRDMIGDLMLFADPPAPQPQPVPIAEAAQDIAASMAEKLQAAGCSLELDIEKNQEVWADRRQFEIVLGCLLQNSLDASPPGTPVVLTSRAAFRDGAPAARICVTDCGRGIDESVRVHLFDPFYSGRQAGRGLGFGLSKCWRIVTNHGGTISFASIPGGETTFEVLWPSAGRPA